MLPYYQIENDVVVERPIKKVAKKCTKCEMEINPENYIKKKTICRACHNENMRNRRKKTF